MTRMVFAKTNPKMFRLRKAQFLKQNPVLRILQEVLKLSTLVLRMFFVVSLLVKAALTTLHLVNSASVSMRSYAKLLFHCICRMGSEHEVFQVC